MLPLYTASPIKNIPSTHFLYIEQVVWHSLFFFLFSKENMQNVRFALQCRARIELLGACSVREYSRR
jgi:hypothetical protein